METGRKEKYFSPQRLHFQIHRLLPGQSYMPEHNADTTAEQPPIKEEKTSSHQLPTKIALKENNSYGLTGHENEQKEKLSKRHQNMFNTNDKAQTEHLKLRYMLRRYTRHHCLGSGHKYNVISVTRKEQTVQIQLNDDMWHLCT